MGDPSHSHQLGIYASFGFHVPFADRIALIRDAGFGATSIWWEEDRPEARRLRHLVPDIVRRAGLYLDNIHVPYKGCNDLWSDIDGDRERAVLRHLSWIEDCRRHQIPQLVMHVTMGNVRPPNAQGLESLRRIVAAGEDAGVRIAIENTRSSEHVHFLLENVPSPTLGLCYDASHAWLYDSDPAALLRNWGHRLSATHLSDTDGKRDVHWLPGRGVIEYPAIAAAFPKESFSGVNMLEVTSGRKCANMEKFLEDAHASLLRLTALFQDTGESLREAS